jgi:lipopolysaccharide transport system ATP-binding protein
MNDTVITVEHLYKEYKLGVISHGTLTRDLQSWWARIRGKEDPNSLISAHHRENTEKDSFLALDDVSFEVKQGDRIGIIGKNGAGKSTLLKILSRITSPTKGTVKIKGRVGSLLEVGTGFHPELTGRENIYLNGAILGMNRREISRKLDEIVDFAGIEKHVDTPVKRYSSGMNVRLGFAVAAHLDTDILIADEVLAVGDAEFQKKALGKMQDLSTGEGRTILFVSHNMGAVKQLCNFVTVLEKGRIRATSYNVEKIISDYLNNFEQNTESMKWVNDKSFCNPFFIPVSMELQEEDGYPIDSEFLADKNYRIKLVFNIEKIDVNYTLYIALNIFDGTNKDVMFYSDPLLSGKDYQLNIGVNTFYFFIPAPLLYFKEEYFLSLGVHRVDGWIINPYEYAVSVFINNVVRRNRSPVRFIPGN